MVSWTLISAGLITLVAVGVLALESGRDPYRDQLDAQESSNPAVVPPEPPNLALLQTPIRSIPPNPPQIMRYLAATRNLIATLQRDVEGGTLKTRRIIPTEVFPYTPTFADREPLPIAQVLTESSLATWDDVNGCINYYAEIEVSTRIVHVHRKLNNSREGCGNACFPPRSNDPPLWVLEQAVALQRDQVQVLSMLERLNVICTLTERAEPSRLASLAKDIGEKVLTDLAGLTRASQRLFHNYASGKWSEEDIFRAVPISILSHTGPTQFPVLLERLYSVVIKIVVRLERATKRDHSFLTIAGREAHVSILYGLRGRQLGIADYLVGNYSPNFLMQKLRYPTNLPVISECSPAIRWPALNEFVKSRNPRMVSENDFLHFRTDLDNLCALLEAHRPSLLAPIHTVRSERVRLASDVLASFGRIFNRLLAWESFLHTLLAAIAHLEDRPTQLNFCINTLSPKPGLTVILDLLWMILGDQELSSGSTLLRQMPSLVGPNLGGSAGGL